MPESVLLTFTLEQDGQGYWRGYVRAPGIEPYPVTAAFLSKNDAFLAVVDAFARRPPPFVDARAGR
jgi:hypothetical protein